MPHIIDYAQIVKESCESLFKCAVTISELSVVFLRFLTSGRQRSCGYAVNVRLGVMAVRLPTGFTMWTVIADKRNGSQRSDVGLVAQPYRKIFDEFAGRSGSVFLGVCLHYRPSETPVPRVPIADGSSSVFDRMRARVVLRQALLAAIGLGNADACGIYTPPMISPSSPSDSCSRARMSAQISSGARRGRGW